MTAAAQAQLRYRIRELKRQMKAPYANGDHDTEVVRSRARACRELAELRADLESAMEGAE